MSILRPMASCRRIVVGLLLLGLSACSAPNVQFDIAGVYLDSSGELFVVIGTCFRGRIESIELRFTDEGEEFEYPIPAQGRREHRWSFSEITGDPSLGYASSLSPGEVSKVIVSVGGLRLVHPFKVEELEEGRVVSYGTSYEPREFETQVCNAN